MPATNSLATRNQRDSVSPKHNDTIPDISLPSNLAAWRDLELAKHRLFYSPLRWNLPLKTRAEDSEHGLVFKFMTDAIGVI
jgi:hypothetical protein